MAHRLWRVPLAAAVAAFTSVSCGSPTAPDGGGLVPVFLVVSCQPAGAGISCSATYHGGQPARDVAASSDWIVEPASRLQSTTPGAFVPVEAGEVSVTARMGPHGANTYAYLVDPGQAARYLKDFMVLVRDADSGVDVGGARVRVMSGYKEGATCVANSSGVCSVTRLMNAEPFSFLVERDEYESATISYVFDELTPGGNDNKYQVRLKRKP